MKKSRVILLPLLALILIVSFMPTKPVYAIATLFTDPPAVVNETLQSGQNFTIAINISNVYYLYSWQVCIYYEPTMLNVTGPASITFGDFFDGHSYFPQLSIKNDEGWILVGQSLTGMGDYVSGSGWLFSVKFLVEDYGSTMLTFDVTDPPVFRRTVLLDSALKEIPFTAVDGYFRNAGPGDVNGDGIVDIFDIGSISAHWYPGPPVGTLGYSKDSDINLDGSVDIFDIGITSANWGNTYP